MPTPALGPHSTTTASDLSRSVGDIAELLDVLYENARHSTGGSLVSATQLRLMCLVDRHPGLRMRALAQLLGATGPSMTRLCDRLEAAGFLRRHPSPGDGREITIRLTPAGEDHLARIRETRERRLAIALDAMPAGTRHALAHGLEGLRQGLTTTADADADLSSQETQPAA
ncbi:MarR family winged helix-turn-helix transcriptional regulator [Streptomyces sp. NPDC001568]|uniref:MarR family winged helix-turn-helix transcriptional regulator n=1 Tax=Streptomyces sp. NPDC001568 TaxID=3364588 RepID=UPI0036A9593E